jgi:predicted RNA-binding protein with TRAM domain
LLNDVAVGDRVRFAVERVDGNYTITALSKAP